MFFHSWLFILFAIAVVGLFYCLPKGLPRRLLLLLAGLYFYACFRPEYLILMLAVVFMDYTVARFMEKTIAIKKRRFFLCCSLFFDLGILFLFKYLGFFEETWNAIFSSLSGEIHLPALLLPMGISFYTFQSLSYVIDVYRKKIPAEKSLLQYSLYVTFFPQLVAGPIENAKHLLPQVRFEEKSFAIENFRDGTFRILQGFFKKAILADTLATIADPVFLNPQDASSLMILVSAIAFAFQIYFDFSGYSDIAIGTARLFGVRLMENFKTPYLALNFYDFWKRWHISLTSWLREYVYFSLGGSRCSSLRHLFNVMAVFFVSGLWHGAAWTFVLWGILHGLIYLYDQHFNQKENFKIWRCVRTFTLVTFLFTLFRAPNFSLWLQYWKSFITHIFSSEGVLIKWSELLPSMVWVPVLFGGAILLFQFLYSNKNVPILLKYSLYLLPLIFFGRFSGQGFIYFQF